MPLTDTAIRTAKPKIKDGKPILNRITDSKGMYLLVTASGQKYFRYDYRIGAQRTTMSLGVYPETSLKEAREKHLEARKLVEKSIHPVEAKKAQKQQTIIDMTNGFETVAMEWLNKNKSKWSENHAKRKLQFLEKDIFPTLGDMPIKNITPRELLIVLEKIQSRGAIETAHRVKSICGEVFRYRIITGRCERDSSQDLKGALIPKVQQHMATITDTQEIGRLLRAIDGYIGDIITKLALKLTPYLMLRPGELRCAEWTETDIENRVWKIPAEKMKMRRTHIVPLSKQVIEILSELQLITGKWKFLFPSLRSKDRPMSNNTINAALRRMGYKKDEITAHGFRAMASTLLHEKGFDTAHIEIQLAHTERNKVKAAYNHAEYLPQRTKMMQWWADYLDELKDWRKETNNE